MARVEVTGSDELTAFLGRIVTDCAEVEKAALGRCAQILKAAVKRNLKRSGDQKPDLGAKGKSSRRRPHLADDIQSRIVSDSFGYKRVRVSGGRKTGTIWHIVNDGTSRSKGTHFMDKSILETEEEIGQVLDEAMRGVGF